MITVSNVRAGKPGFDLQKKRGHTRMSLHHPGDQQPSDSVAMEALSSGAKQLKSDAPSSAEFKTPRHIWAHLHYLMCFSNVVLN